MSVDITIILMLCLTIVTVTLIFALTKIEDGKVVLKLKFKGKVYKYEFGNFELVIEKESNKKQKHIKETQKEKKTSMFKRLNK